MNIRIEIVEGGTMPKKALPGDACYDVFARDIELNHNKVICYLGIKSEIPEGYKAVMTPRSSFTHKSWILANSPCQIDAGYRGEWQCRFEAIPTSSYMDWPEYNSFPYQAGDRVAQFYIEKVIPTELELVDSVGTSERGEGGFGHTGK